MTLSGRVRAILGDGAALRYVGVGVFNSLLDLGLFTLFSVALGITPLVANVMSTSITLCVSYFLNRHFVFRSNVGYARSAVQFVTVTLFSGLVVQSGVIWLVTTVGAHWAPGVPVDILKVVAKVLAMGVGMVTNYLGYRWLFRAQARPRARSVDAGEEAAPEEQSRGVRA